MGSNHQGASMRGKLVGGPLDGSDDDFGVGEDVWQITTQHTREGLMPRVAMYKLKGTARDNRGEYRIYEFTGYKD
jgi:hypothetical protein